jgi:hypothetical protein
MTLADLIEAAERLSPEERLALAQHILASLDDGSFVTPTTLTILDMAGFLKPEGDMPTDQDVEARLVEHLEEKYR